MERGGGRRGRGRARGRGGRGGAVALGKRPAENASKPSSKCESHFFSATLVDRTIDRWIEDEIAANFKNGRAIHGVLRLIAAPTTCTL